MLGSVFVLLVSLFSYNQGHAQECISRADLEEVSEHFEQFVSYLEESESSSFCPTNMDPQGYAIARAVVTLKNISPKEPNLNEEDAFSFQAIDEKDWWSYYTERSHAFRVDNNCPEFVVAYVNPFFLPGIVNLCTPFFENELLSQISTLMHEVRHFDGHRHVECTRGNEEGFEGACDEKITDKGSYAISVQTLVSLARSENLDPMEKTIAESRAIYTGFNKFNELPRFSINDYLYLSSSEGEVYEWLHNFNSTELDLVGVLDAPAKIEAGFSGVTVYPVDPTLEAYRLDHNYDQQIRSIGLYAEYYNDLDVSERLQVRDVSYDTDGGILKGNVYVSLCDGQNILETDLSGLDTFDSMIGIRDTEDITNTKNHLVSSTGDIYSVVCPDLDASSSEPMIENTGLNIVLEEGVKIIEGREVASEQFVLLDNGEVRKLEISGSSYVLIPTEFNQNALWVGLTNQTKPEVFDEERVSSLTDAQQALLF